MMDLLLATSGGEAQAASGGYVDDVFSAYVRTGTGADVTVNTNIDMTKGYMLWTKGRSGATDHAIYDSARGVTFDLASNLTSAQTTQSTGLKSVSGTGHTIGSLAKMNTNAATYVDWVFRKSPKFFDVVTYTGNGASNRALSHQLNADVGMIMVKATSTTGDWWVFHRSATGDLVLNTTAAQTASKANIPSATTSTFTVNGSANTNGVTYVAYLWAHDPSADGIIQCGSYTGNGSATGQTVALGWEPQWVLVKSSTLSTGSSQWSILDNMRGSLALNSQGNDLFAQSSAAENIVGAPVLVANATGFNLVSPNDRVNGSGQTYIYLAIRRQNKPPTSGTEVYNAIARTGTGAAATVTGVGFAPDLWVPKGRSGSTGTGVFDRLRGKDNYLDCTGNSPDGYFYDIQRSFDQNGVSLGSDTTFNAGSTTYINHFFRRTTGFFDVVCDSGTGVAHGITHGLSVAPEFIIRKSRSGSTQWECWHSALAATEKLVLNSIAAKATDATAWNSTLPTPMQFTVGVGVNVNTNAATYVTYLFATLAGISKVGSYTGNGSSQTIDCGFGTGARFVLIKRTDAAGDWYVWDTSRGIVAANDPHLSLNTTAAEVTTDDSVDPEASGFIINQNTATNINVNGGSYIFLAIA